MAAIKKKYVDEITMAIQVNGKQEILLKLKKPNEAEIKKLFKKSQSTKIL